MNDTKHADVVYPDKGKLNTYEGRLASDYNSQLAYNTDYAFNKTESFALNVSCFFLQLIFDLSFDTIFNVILIQFLI